MIYLIAALKYFASMLIVFAAGSLLLWILLESRRRDRADNEQRNAGKTLLSPGRRELTKPSKKNPGIWWCGFCKANTQHVPGPANSISCSICRGHRLTSK